MSSFRTGDWLASVIVFISFFCLFCSKLVPYFGLVALLCIFGLLVIGLYSERRFWKLMILVVMGAFCLVLWVESCVVTNTDRQKQLKLDQQVQLQLQQEILAVQHLSEEQRKSGYKLVTHQGDMETHP
jgi:hypothetical protein